MKITFGSYLIASVLTLLVTANEGGDLEQQALRRVLEDRPEVAALIAANHQRSRQLQQNGFGSLFTSLAPFLDFVFNPCNLVQRQFPASAGCNCTGTLFSGLKFTCAFQPLCVGGAGAFCSTPSYSGTLSFFKLTSANTVCFSGLTIPGLPAGDLCVNIDFNPASNKILTCKANYLGFICINCVPCPGGISLGTCGSALKECTPILGLVSGVFGNGTSAQSPNPPLQLLKELAK
jgi:hypothetical protein